MNTVFHYNKAISGLIFVLIFLAFSCKEKSSSPTPEPAPDHWCVNVRDYETQQPMNNVSLMLHNSGMPTAVFAEFTDSSGNWCGNFGPNTLNFSRVVHSHNGDYFDETIYCCNPPSVLNMQQRGYVLLHVKNIAVQDTADWIFVDVSGFLQYNFKGANIDTTLVVTGDPRKKFIRWKVWHNLMTQNPVLVGSDSISCNILSGDTTVLTDVLY